MKELLKRLNLLLIKVISVKGLILGLATWLCMFGKIDGVTWMLSASAVAGIRAYEKKKAG